MNNIEKWIWLAQKCGAGNSEVLALVEKFESVDHIYESDLDDYISRGVSERLAEDLCDKALDEANSIIRTCESIGAGVLCYGDKRYPSSLRTLKDPPVVLYYLGELPDFNGRLCISVVGTRTMSEYGMRAAYKIAYEVASAGAIVVSGMALGIDGVASAAAIAAKGKTVVVLGCGIDVVYPKEHLKLKERIRQNGAIITEYPPMTQPRGMHFPVRNRIISAISQGTVVVDADMSSGAMITAKNAILQGKDIYAVPCNIDSRNSSGTNSLIRDGAQAVLCGADIIKNYVYMYRDKLDVKKMNDSVLNSEFDSQVLWSMGVGARGYASKTSADELTSYKPYKKPRATRSAKSATVEKIPEQQAHKPETEESKREMGAGDNSAKVLETLTEKQRKVFDEMPLDRAVTVDYLTKTGFKLGEVMSALTILEVKGLVSSLPGALYIRK